MVDSSKCQSRAFKTLCTKYFPSLDYNDYYQKYQEVNARTWQRHYNGEISKDELKVIRFEETFPDCTQQIPSLIRFYEDTLAAETHFMPNAVSILDKLRVVCRLVIVTNGFGDVHRRRFATSGILHYFAGMIVSGDKEITSYRKPHTSIFQDAHERFGPTIAKNRILMLGDTESTDIAGGITYGIDTCRFAPFLNTTAVTTSATYCVSNWSEIPGIVGVGAQHFAK